MHAVSIVHSKVHKFDVTIDHVTIQLSYKNFGGRSAVLSLGSDGLERLICDAEMAIVNYGDASAIYALFQTAGCANALLLLGAACPQDFVEYWTRMVYQRKAFGAGISFRSVLQAVSGTKATLGHNNENPFVNTLKEICNSAALAPVSSDYCLPLSSADTAQCDNIRVTYLCQANNSHFFDLNGKNLSLCTNRVSDITTTHELLNGILTLKNAIQRKENLTVFTARWGGSFVFRVLSIICPEETMEYFLCLAQQKTQYRELIEPRKMIEAHNFSCNDQANTEFIGQILSVLERARASATPILVDGNNTEIDEHNDQWTLYYQDGNTVAFRCCNFGEIQNPALRIEVVTFLRALWYSSDTFTVTQIARYYYLLRDGLNALSAISVFTIRGTTLAHARMIKSHLECTLNKSPNLISETLLALGRMFQWTVLKYEGELTRLNPYWEIDLPNKQKFLKNTTPAKEQTLRIISAHITDLPMHLQLAYELLLLTLARAYDVFHLLVDDFTFYEDHSGILRFVASKNHRTMTFKIPAIFGMRLQNYIAETAEMRKELEKNYLLIYRPTGVRAGSSVSPTLLSYGKFNYHINKLLEGYSPEQHITARQIRAEGGRRYHAADYTSSQISILLGNTPSVAKRHYRALSARDEAELYHRAYRAYFKPYDTDINTNSPVLLWGHCKTSAKCRNQKICSTCPFLQTTEVNQHE